MLDLANVLQITYCGTIISNFYSRIGSSVETISSGVSLDANTASSIFTSLIRGQIVSGQQNARNVSDAISMVQTFEYAACSIREKLTEMAALAEQAQAGIYSACQRQVMQEQLENIAEEINYIADNTSYNGHTLLSASAEPVSISLGDGFTTTILPSDLTIDTEGMDLTTDQAAASASAVIQAAAAKTAEYIGYLAGRTKQLASASQVIAFNIDNALGIESISDADLAAEVTVYAAKQVLENLGAIYRLQMNIVPELVLGLLNGSGSTG